MAWSAPALERRKWLVEQARDYATNLSPPPSQRHQGDDLLPDFETVADFRRDNRPGRRAMEPGRRTQNIREYLQIELSKRCQIVPLILVLLPNPI